MPALFIVGFGPKNCITCGEYFFVDFVVYYKTWFVCLHLLL